MTKKIVAVLLALLCLNYSLSYAQQKEDRVTLHLTNATLKEVFRQMQTQTGKYFGYQSKDLEGLPRLKFDCTNEPLEDALKQLLRNTGLTFAVKGNNVLIKKSQETPAGARQVDIATTRAENRTISGRVINSEQQGIPGVSILGLLSKKTAFTNDNGEYFIQIPEDETMLSFSSVGFQNRNVMMEAAKTYNVTLQERVGNLKQVEVVSTGYVNLPKERATGSFGVVTAKDLEKIPVPNVLHRLEGQVAGVQLNLTESDNSFVYTNLNGAVQGNGSYDITIRGASTLNNDVNKKPLVVIDGFPTEMDIRTINPADVEQITFLKDAAAASIWGARASAGVIVITTKKGKINDGAPRISFSAGLGINGKPRLSSLPLMNAAQMIDYEQELVNKRFITDPTGLPAASQRPISEAVDWMFRLKRGEVTQAQVDAAFAVLKGRDSRKQVEQYLLTPASTSHYDLNVSGGTGRHTYFVSGAYDKENTSTKNTFGERMTLTANQEFTFFKNVTLSANLRGSWFRYRTGGQGISVYGRSPNPLMPYDQLVDDNGNSVNYARAYYSGRLSNLEAKGYMPWRYNYINELALSDNTTNESNYAATFALNIPLYKGLSFNAQYMAERASSGAKNFNSDSSYYTRNMLNTATSIDANGKLVYGIPLGGIMETTDYSKNNYSIRGQLNLDRNFSGNHQVNALLGMEARQTIDGSGSNRMFGFNTQTQYSKPVDYVTPYVTVDGYQSVVPYGVNYSSKRRRYLSYYGNFSYTYAGKYTLSGSARYDDYNNFGLDKKYRAKPFWSAGAAWALSKEDFMQNVSWVSGLTLRATYGINGNISTTALPYDQLYLLNDYQYPFDPYSTVGSPANPSLRWEQTGVYNVGLDYALFDNRLNGAVEFYYKKGTDLFASFPIDNTVGFDNITRNTSSLTGKGIDLSLGGSIIRNKEFEWSANLVFAYNTNKVTDARYNVTNSLLQSGGVGGPIKGFPTDYLMVFRYAGLDRNGSPRVIGGKGDTLTIYQSPKDISDLKNAGRLSAPYFGSLRQTVRYKGFSLFVLVTYKLGYVFQRPVPGDYPGRYGFQNYDYNKLVDQRWRKPGDEAFTNVPGLSGNSTGQIRYANADINVLPGDHIRLREVSLTYNVPAALFHRLPVKGISLTGAARNLALLWTKNEDGIDPDFPPSARNVKLPPSASYNFSLNVSF
ncbi:TonB-linked outer membrane protein, SusC/RagA family [Chitinophaga ginsengisegetis]|uniref:TonB-linked outer membrane protein, SusC/RagA family n=1 Tax=Chitinophaga ginsengisegetis TaxID=393003 RepID=A0A1T5P9K2_9BACT|nr:SusC/RagA family TonB-linked outer membrane protein [Chitinophaga ginsengisegetis]SKD09297.1 TonB-linked outer membrane protein, SusC/RagA family [Chitinophaga ginsengisegetis]